MPTRVPGRSASLLACCALAIIALPGFACSSGSSQPSYPAQYPPAGQAPSAAPAVPAGQSAALPAPGVAVLPVVNDPINAVELGFLRGQAQALLNELVASLPTPQQQRVAGIPLVVDSTLGEVNAFAMCTAGRNAAMAITDGLLEIDAYLSQARATDELFGTHKLNDYIQLIVREQRPKRPIVRPPPGFFDVTQQVDGRKVLRQHQLLEEQIAFVLGHELAHHYLGHLPCTSAGQLPLAELGQALSGTVPLFNQPNEIAADSSGMNNLMTMGFRRQGYRLNEGGALVTMQFFAGLEQFNAAGLIFAFQNSHPPAVFRAPIIQQTVAAWKLTSGRGLPYLF